MKTFSGLIGELADNQVFVFGSNMNGFHGGGSAGFAFRDKSHVGLVKNGTIGKWCIWGVGNGYQAGWSGSSYALPTIDEKMEPLPIEQIKSNIEKFYKFAEVNPCREFLVAYTTSNPHLICGYSIYEMSDCFASFKIPENVVFEEEFNKLVYDIIETETKHKGTENELKHKTVKSDIF